MATFGASAVSLGLKSRPRLSGIPNARSVPGVMIE
jgi:hypothetical protein